MPQWKTRRTLFSVPGINLNWFFRVSLPLIAFNFFLYWVLFLCEICVHHFWTFLTTALHELLLKCRDNDSLRLNVLWHLWHPKGFNPKWTSKWRFSSAGRAKFRGQSIQMCLLTDPSFGDKGLTLESWTVIAEAQQVVLMWFASVSLRENSFPQPWHWYCLTEIWTEWWRNRSDFRLNVRWHFKHGNPKHLTYRMNYW
jgi:hypothetical protein